MRIERKRKSNMPTIIFVVAVVFLLFFALKEAKAGEDLEQLLEGKRVVYSGVCGMDTPNSLAMTEKDVKMKAPCVIGMEVGNQEDRWVGLVNEDGEYFRVIKMTKKDGKVTQKVVWDKKPKTKSIQS